VIRRAAARRERDELEVAAADLRFDVALRPVEPPQPEVVGEELAPAVAVHELFDDGDDGAIEERSAAYQRVMRELLAAEHAELLTLRNEGVINDNVMQRVQRDLDLEAARLDQ